MGIGAGFASEVWIELHQFLIALVPLAFLIVVGLLEFVVADVLADLNYPLETEQKLKLLEQQLGSRAVSNISAMLRELIGKFEGCDNTQISATVHLVIDLSPTPEHQTRQGLLQLTDYAGPHGGKKGRITTIDQGIIGRCARTGKTEYTNFADETEYRDRMVREFGFTRQQADSHTKVARSYLAHPIGRDSQVLGIMYFFSTEPQVFPNAADLDDLVEVADGILRILSTAAIV